MNVLQGNIIEIITEEEISLVKVDAAGNSFTAIVIDTPERSAYLKPGHPVRLLFKETEVIIATTSPLAISVQNRHARLINKINTGKILSALTPCLEGSANEFRPIITRNACRHLSLQTCNKVTALIQTSAI